MPLTADRIASLPAIMSPEQRRRASAEMVRRLIDETKMPRNQVAAAAGLTNTYIRDLEQGNIANVSREKLIQFAVALNLNLTRIDELLKVFDRASLSSDDIPLFLNAALQGRSTTALYPLRDFYAYELVVYCLECIPGDQVMVNDRPTVSLRSPGHRTFSDSSLVKAHPLYAELVETIGRVRRAQLEKNLERFRIVHYICRQCLEDYVLHSGDPTEERWRKEHIQNLLEYLGRYPNLEVHLTGVCCYMLFSIKEPRDGSPIQFNFCAKPGHYIPGDRPRRLSGFSTTNPVILQTFREELESIKGWTLEEFEDRSRLESYLEELIGRRS